MSALVLELKADDMLIINGAPMRVRNKTRIELNGAARFMFGKQIMPPGGDTTPARRIYYAIQTAYIGNDSERPIPTFIPVANQFATWLAERTGGPEGARRLCWTDEWVAARGPALS